MKSSKRLSKKLNQRFAEKQDELDRRPAVMGDGAGNLYVTGFDNFVYVTMGDKAVPVFNNRVPPQTGLQVWVGYAAEEPTLFQVLSTRSESPAGVQTGFVGYAPARRYEWMARNGGQDPLSVHLRAFTPLKLSVSPDGWMFVDLYRGFIYSGSAYIAVPRQNVDLYAQIPTTAGKAAFVLITINTSGTVVQTKGSEVDIDVLAITDIPAIPAGTSFICGAVRVYYGQLEIQEGRTNTDFVDLRFPGYAGGGIWQPLDADLTAIAALSPSNDDIIQRKAGAWTNRTLANFASDLSTEITERAQDAIGAMVADTATIDITYTDATPELKADVRVDSINDTHIDWGTGTNQVSLDDVPDGSTYVKITATNHTDLTDGGNTTLHTHGIYGLLSGTLAQFAATTSLELKGVISDETGTGALVFANTPTLISPVISNFFYANHTHAASGVTGGTLASATGLPLTTGVTGILPAANGGTGIDNSTRTLTISTNAGTISFSAAASTLTIPATGTAALLATANVFTANQTLGGAADPKLILNEGNTGTSLFEIIDTSTATGTIKKTAASGVALIDIDPIPADGSSNSAFRFFRFTNTTGQVYLQIFKGDGTATTGAQISGSAAANTFFGTQNNVGVGTASPAGKLHVVGLTDDEQFIVDFYSTQSTVPNPIRFRTSAGADLFTFSALGAFLSTGATGGIGYTTGAGGTVTQATNKATGVTLNKVTGLITMNNAALAADTTVSFTLTSSAIAATDTIILQHNSAGTVGAYTFGAQPAAGSAVINVRNVTAGSLSEAIVIRYTVIKSISA